MTSIGARSIDELMALPWQYSVSEDPDGGLALQVWPLNDFVLYGDSEAELAAEWRNALRSHLEGYLACGKAVPFARIADLSGETRSTPASGDSGAYLALA